MWGVREVRSEGKIVQVMGVLWGERMGRERVVGCEEEGKGKGAAK